MRSVDYVTHGFGGFFDDLIKAGVSVAPPGVVVAPTSTMIAHSIVDDLSRSKIPEGLSNDIFTVVSRYGKSVINPTIQFLVGYGEGLRAFRGSGIGPAAVQRLGLKGAYLQLAQSAFNASASRFGLNPLSKVIRDYTLSEISKARNDESAGNALLYIPSGFYDLLKKYA